MDNIHTALPGVITAYDYTTKKASVQPTIKKIFENGEKLTMPIITNVPVIFPGTSKGVIHFEITPGQDTCLIVFTERSLENWLSSDPTQSAEPGDPRQMDLSDAVCIPGLFSLASPGKVANTGSGLEIINENGYINLLNDGTMELNGNTKSFVTHAELDSALQTFITALNTHTHSAAAMVAGPYPVTGVTGVPVAGMSVDISAAKTITIKTS